MVGSIFAMKYLSHGRYVCVPSSPPEPNVNSTLVFPMNNSCIYSMVFSNMFGYAFCIESAGEGGIWSFRNSPSSKFCQADEPIGLVAKFSFTGPFSRVILDSAIGVKRGNKSVRVAPYRPAINHEAFCCLVAAQHFSGRLRQFNHRSFLARPSVPRIPQRK